MGSGEGESVGAPGSPPQGLQANAVGLVSVLFQSVANMAPAASVAFSILFAASYAGGATPLAVLVGLILCLLVAITIGQMAKYLPSAGGLYTYNARGLGTYVGFLVGWAFIMAEVVVAPGGLLIVGIVVSGALHSGLGWPLWVWAPCVVLGALAVWILVYRGIRLSTTASVALGLFEIVVFLGLAITLIVHAGSANTVAVFNPSNHNKHGIGSLIPGILYAVFGVIGFEAAAPLGEEARDPKRVIPRAVFGACLGIGVFYLVCYYAATVFFGPSKMTTFIDFNASDPWTGMAKVVWGLGFIVLIIALVSSAIAGSNASSVSTTRVGYSLARIRMLPRVLARIHPRFGTPSVALHVQIALAVGYALVLGFVLKSPLNALVLQGTISAVLIITIYICTGISCIVFYLREHRHEINPLLHIVIPFVGSIAFIPVLLAAFGIDFAGLGITSLAWPANYAPYVAFAWMALGGLVLAYFAITDRDRIAQTRVVFAEQEPEEIGIEGPGGPGEHVT